MKSLPASNFFEKKFRFASSNHVTKNEKPPSKTILFGLPCKFKIEEAFPTVSTQADDEFKSH